MSTKNNRFVVREYTSSHFINGRIFKEKVIGIGIFDKEKKFIMPSPLTNFIRSNYRGKNSSLSSQRNAAYEITKFLNYTLEQIENNDDDFSNLFHQGLFDLSLVHGSSYITFLSLKARNGELDSDYIYRIEKYLIKFYKWLSDNKIIKETIQSDCSPFMDLELGTIYPGRSEKVKSKLVDFGKNRLELSLLFINIAKIEAPEIVLGICFQFFGGLRVGEVVNLTKDSIESPYFWNNQDYGKDKFILLVRDRQKELFPDKKNLQHEQVKRPRNQALLLNPILSQIYQEHKSYLEKLTKQGLVLNNSALFISKNTKSPLSGKTYKQSFRKVKKAFLNYLSKNNRVDDYLFLAEKNWSTHIGRGVFTNILLEIGGTIPEIAIARGDKNINSVLAYVEEKNALELTNKAINEIRNAYENEVFDAYSKKEASINTDLQKNLKLGDFI
jgi:hypothetical protein